jgi:hypothetical protein
MDVYTLGTTEVRHAHSRVVRQIMEIEEDKGNKEQS